MSVRELVKRALGEQLRRRLKARALRALAPELHLQHWHDWQRSPIPPVPTGCSHSRASIEREDPRPILRCPDCRVAFPRDPQLKPDQTDYYTPDAFATMYKHERGRLPSLWDSMMCHAIFLHGSGIMLQDPPNRRALDMGCGGGHFLKFLHGYCGFEPWGIEPSEWGVRHCREEFQLPNIVQAMDPDEAALPDDFFGFVSLIHTLEHVPDPIETLKKLHRVAAPGASFFGEVPDSDFYGDWGHWEHRWFFNEQSLDFHLRSSGWEVQRIFAGRTLPWPEPVAFLSWYATKPR